MKENLAKATSWLFKLQEKVCSFFNDGLRYNLLVPDRVHGLNGPAEQFIQISLMADGLERWLSFAFVLYRTGLLGRIYNNKNFLVTRRSVEIMYLGAITSFVIYGNARNDPRGSVYGLLLLILAACEGAVGLGLLVAVYRLGLSVRFKDYQELGG